MGKIEKYKEIFKLKKMLEREKIPFEFLKFDVMSGYQIRLNENCDVIERIGSYGEKQDLLEIMGAMTKEEMMCDSVLGYLSAKEVFKRFKYCYENNTNIYKEQK